MDSIRYRRDGVDGELQIHKYDECRDGREPYVELYDPGIDAGVSIPMSVLSEVTASLARILNAERDARIDSLPYRDWRPAPVEGTPAASPKGEE